uniref:Vesicle transport protein USE1 n=1 Tax=Caenorhabditis tropicalis TaxID=1561998 RepID=A0A1I7T8D7_9PELO
MTCITETELKFLRLLERTKRLTKENLSANVWKVTAATKSLNKIHGALRDIDETNDMLPHYYQEILQLQSLAEAEKKSSAEESLKVIEKIPRVFLDVSEGKEEFESAAGLRIIQKSIYRSDLRKQLLSSNKKANSGIKIIFPGKKRKKIAEDEAFIKNERLEEDLANDLLSMTKSLKTVMSAAGEVIKDDNQRLTKMQKQIEDNKAALETESSRLEHHAYKCGFDCMRLFLVVFLFWSFISMVVIMKVFPKRVSY